MEESPHVTAPAAGSGTRIGTRWPTGYAVRVVRSPGFVGRGNVLFRQEHGFWFYNSPNAR
jgi:hypothetical protein